MSENESKKIIRLLNELSIKFELIKHNPTITSEDSARERKSKLEEGVKALLLKERNSNNFFIANLPADRKADLKKIAKKMNIKSCTLASKEEVKEITGCEIGGVPPFGQKNNVKLITDLAVFENEFNEFNAGQRTLSIRMKTKDLKKVLDFLKADYDEISREK